MEESVREYPKDEGLFNVLHWVSLGSIAVGIVFMLITFLDSGGVLGAYLAVGVLHPFVDIQVAYLIWENDRYYKNIWKNVQGIATAVGMFLGIDILSNLLWYYHYYKTLAGVVAIISGEAVMFVVTAVIVFFVGYMNKKVL